MNRFWCVVLFLVLTSATSWAEKRPSEKPKPLIADQVFRVKDGRRLKTMLQQNGWWKEFLGSSLYRGLVVRQSLLLDSLGEQNSKAWQGKLVDFIYERLLDGRPFSLSYFRAPKLVSPLGFTFYRLGSTEKRLVGTFLTQLHSGDPVPVDIYDSESAPPHTVQVMAVHLRGSKLALVVHGDCLSLSADPRIAATLSQHCDPMDFKSDAELATGLKSFAAPAFGVLKKFFKSADTARTEFEWNDSEHVFRLTRMTLGLEPGSAFSATRVPPELLKAVPGEAWLAASVLVPKPATWSREDVRKILAPEEGSAKAGPKIPMTLVFMGMGKPEKFDPSTREPVKVPSLTAVLLPSDSSEQALSDLNQLFSKKVFYDVRLRVVCTNWVALADNDESLDRIEKTCKGEIPSFEQIPPELKSRLTSEPAAAWIYLNLGKAMSSMIELGVAVTADEKAPSSEAIRTSHGLLGKLPRVLLAGEEEGSQLVLKGTLK